MAIERRFVVVGLGSIGRRHARLLNQRSDLSVEFVEPNSEALARGRCEIGNLPTHESFSKMLETRPEMVLIATPHSLHAWQTIQALEAGAHVFCEKPMADNTKNGLRMKKAAAQTGKVLNIGFHLHFHPGLQTLKDIITDRALGTILHAHVRMGTYITLVNSLSRYQADLEGALLLDYAHQPDILYWLLGQKPKRLYTSAIQAGNLEQSSNPNVAIVTCEYDSTMISSIHLNYVQTPERHEYEIVGDKGWVILNVNENTMAMASKENQNVTTTILSPTPKDDLLKAEHQAFLDAVDGKRTAETSAGDGLVSLAVCEAAIESWKTHEPVKVPL